MTIDSVEPVEGDGSTASPEAAPTELPVAAVWVAPAEEIASDPPVSDPPVSDPPASDPAATDPTATAALDPGPIATSPPPPSRRWFRRGLPSTRAPRVASQRRRLVGFVLAFTVGSAAVLALLAVAAIGLSNTYRDRIQPGVHAGSVDLAGLTRDQAMAKLQSGYANLGTGLVTITTPTGTATISYQQAGRGPDVEAMADAAMAVGHSGNSLADGASVVHSAVFGQDIPIVVKVDSTAIAQRIHDLDRVTLVAPRDAQATTTAGNFTFTPGTEGRGLDEMATGSAVIEKLSQAGAASDLQMNGTFVILEPQVSDKDAQDAIARAWKMVLNVNVTWTAPPAGAPASWKPQSWTIGADQVRGWIVFGTQQDGTYGPSVDQNQMADYVASVSGKVGLPPVEPGIVWDPSGKPVDLTAGKDGLGVDPSGTSTAVSTYLDKVASGGSSAPNVEIVTGPIHPQITSVASISDMVIVGQWTTTFYPDISNGNGKNIRQPAANLNGQVINPGAQFSFLGGVGPIDTAHGFTLGGVILNGLSNHTGAMGGGICSASTTMFNAAATAGLKIDERHAHEYYIYRYPVGRDATVYSNGVTTYDLKWTNDTPYPIVIRAWTTYGSKSTITIQLWSWPLNRTVTWTGGGMANIVQAVENPPVYTNKLAAGKTARAEYATNGFWTAVTRTVKDASGAILHSDTWQSSYVAVNGQLQIGGSPPAPPAPPAPDPTPSPTPPASGTP